MTTAAWLPTEPGETVEWSAHPRLTRAVPAIVASLVLAAGGAAAVARGVEVGLAALVCSPLPAVYGYLRVVRTRFVVTDRAVYRRRGVLGTAVRTVELGRIQNTRSTQSVTGRLFGHGAVDVEVAGGRDLRLYAVYDPVEVRRLIERRRGRVGSVPGTAGQWRAVRDELREIRRRLEDQPK